MKRNGRKLDHKALEAIRKIAIRRIREGEQPSVVIASYGFHRSVVYRWMKVAAGHDQDMQALASRKATGRPRKLTAPQERKVSRRINGKSPMRYGLDADLWTRQTVRELVQQEFGVTLSLGSIGALLARQGLTPQKPLQRAHQRDPEATERWQRDAYPAIARQAKAEKADICFWDEFDFRADAAQGEMRGAKEEGPAAPGQPQSISAAAAVNTKGAFWFVTYQGALTGNLMAHLLKKLMLRRKKPLHLALDSLPAHKEAVVKDYVQSTKGKLTLHYLPGHAL